MLTNTDAHVVSGSEDGEIVFWDLVDATVRAPRIMLPLPFSAIALTSLSPCSRCCAPPAAACSSMLCSRLNRALPLLCTSHPSHALTQRVSASLQVVHRLKGHSVVVSDVAYHPKPGQTRMLSSDVSGKIKVWEQ